MIFFSCRFREEVSHFLGVAKPAIVVVSDREAARLLDEVEGAMYGVDLKIIVEHDGMERRDGWVRMEELSREVGDVAGPELKNGVGDGGRIDGSIHSIQSVKEPSAPTINGTFTHCEGAVSGEVVGEHSQSEFEATIDVEGVLFIIFTSGTSGLPKACPWTSKNIWGATLAGRPLTPKEPTDVMLQLAPPSHSMGIVNLIHAWLIGAMIVIPSAAFDVKATLQAISDLKCTHISGGTLSGSFQKSPEETADGQ